MITQALAIIPGTLGVFSIVSTLATPRHRTCITKQNVAVTVDTTFPDLTAVKNLVWKI
jgi:hypothetical protein